MEKLSNTEAEVKKTVAYKKKRVTGKHLCRSLFFHKIVGLRHGALIKIRYSDTGVFLLIMRNF